MAAVRRAMWPARILATLALLASTATNVRAQGLPAGFVDESIAGGFTAPVSFCFDANGRLYVAERRGLVWILDAGVVLPQPLIDLQEEIAVWRDHGLLAFALDPGFVQNGAFYLYYVVDRHHLLYAGTPLYDPAADAPFDATIARLTRYTADPATGFTTTLPGSRQVLLGESLDRGVPILHESHAGGGLAFGRDGTLLLATGDGASFNAADTGNAADTYHAQALADGILRVEENVGAFRAQMLQSLNGKLLRLDPATGDGAAGNPWFDPLDPRATRSRVLALGLRNPFRLCVRPGTGATDPRLGRPGSVYVADVGFNRWEELSVVTAGGVNLGWPLFEGLEAMNLYVSARTVNLDAPNPLYDGASCAASHFDFQDLLMQEQADHNPWFPNPCDPSQRIPLATPTFMHTRPVLDYHHDQVLARVAVFDGNDADEAVIGSPGSGVSGAPFQGNCGAGGVWLGGAAFPPPYGNAYYHADFAMGWLRRFGFDAAEVPVDVEDFAPVPSVTCLAEDPADGSLVYLDHAGAELRRIRYDPSYDPPPLVRLEADEDPVSPGPRTASGPLAVRWQLDARDSQDPTGQSLSYHWDLGDGTTSTRAQLGHTFRAAGPAPTAFPVTLTVTDTEGNASVARQSLPLANTAPLVQIVSLTSGDLYATDSTTVVPLVAQVLDAEHGPGDLSYVWQTFLHHDNHVHEEALDINPVTTTTLTPTPCDGSFYAYRVQLTVTDAAGLAGQAEVWLFPDCPTAATATWVTPAVGGAVRQGQPVPLELVVNGPVDGVQFFLDETLVDFVSAPPFLGQWLAQGAGWHVASAVVQQPDGTSFSSAGLALFVEAPRRLRTRVAAWSDDGAEDLATGAIDRSARPLHLGSNAGAATLAAVRFAALAIPAGSTIRSAHLDFTVGAPTRGPALLIVDAEASDDAPPLRDTPYDLSARSGTGATVAWSPPDWQPRNHSSAAQTSPDLALLVQEVIDRPGWRSGQALLLRVQGSGERAGWSHDGSPATAPMLTVDFWPGNQAPAVDVGPDLSAEGQGGAALSATVQDDGLPGHQTLSLRWTQEDGPGTATFADAGAAATTVAFDATGSYTLRLTASDGQLSSFDELQVEVEERWQIPVSVGPDDAAEAADGRVDRQASTLSLGESVGGAELVALRFSLPAGPGAQILAAHLQFTAATLDVGGSVLSLSAEASDDAPGLQAVPGDLSRRPRTQAAVAWLPAPWPQAGNSGPRHRTPDLSAMLQEIVDRPGWQAGAAVVLFVEGTGRRTATSFEAGIPAVLDVRFRD